MLHSQNSRTISGIVLDDATRLPLPGATILVQGTAKGASTDIDGKFNYTITSSKSVNEMVLTVSYLGFKTQRVTVGDRSYFEILLQEDAESLGEVVVTSSYGTKKIKQEVVGSVAKIKPSEIISEQPAVTFDDLLEGQIAGVFIDTNNRLGEETSINIRGQGSLTPLGQNIVGTSTQPLIIVDGIILSEELGIDGSNFFDAGTGNISENILNPLARVGIQDIESFNVLKDAAAVGLYGADAANGVIIITTKSGKQGKPSFSFGIQSGFSTAINEYKYLDGFQYQNILNQYNINNGNFESVTEWNGVNTDWFDLLNETGTFNRINFGVNGGSERWRYRANATYQINNEAQVNNDFKKLNTSFALDYNHNKLSASLRFSPSIAEKNDPNTLYNFAVAPNIPLFDDNGELTAIPTFGNPVAVANQNIRESKTLAFLTSLNLNYSILPNLKFTTLFGMDLSFKDEDRFFSGLNGSGQLNGDGFDRPLDQFQGQLGRRIQRERNTNRWNWSANLFYDTVFDKKHTFDALVGIETRRDFSDQSFAKGDDFINFATPQPISEAFEQDYEEDSIENTGRSLFSQLNYNYKKLYFLLVNARIDQSSAFGSDRNTALNAGIGASWNISSEEFFDPNGFSFVDFLRLRISYGSTGNSRIGSYRARGLYILGFNGYNGSPIYGNPSSAPNPNLGWERNNKFNLGVDFNIFGKYKMTVDYFRDNIQDIITSRDVISESGFTSAQINGASMINQGVEFSIQADWINTDTFKWNTSFNISRITNEITSLSGLGSEFSAAERARSRQVGFSNSTIWGFQFVGIDPATGRELYNVGGDIYDASYVRQNFTNNDWEPLGDSQPEFFGGLRNSISYKGFDLNVILSFTAGQETLLDRDVLDNYNILVNRNLGVNIWQQAWQEQGDIAIYPAISRTTPIVSNSSKYVFDESHIKLKSINLSYNLDTKALKLPLKNLSVFANASNIGYWFFNEGSNFGNSIAELRSIYPEMMTISFGLNTNF
ncbi:SusC/RagA family TonB-linked outer membrane protein [Winogradskyella maritima]|uniref:SusC/RagA family TonB-linked outer membrane protein n=2 Tax=Winogradskyella maritima TaxID=1517766 RepID=A0ABV8AHF0_9FLAO